MSATPATLRRPVAWTLVHWPVTTPISASTLATVMLDGLGGHGAWGMGGAMGPQAVPMQCVP